VSVSDLSRVLPKYNQAVASLGTTAKIAANETQQQAGGLQDVSQAAQDAAQKLQQLRDSAQQAFSGSVRHHRQFQPGKSDAAVTRAQDKLIASKKSLDPGRGPLRRAEEALGVLRAGAGQRTRPGHESHADLTAAQRKASSESNLQKIYADDLAKGQQFVKDIRSLLKRGLDPAEVERLLTAGPEKSGALARALSSDKSGKLIKLSNQNERQLANLAIRAANLMQQALDKHPVFVTVGAAINPLLTPGGDRAYAGDSPHVAGGGARPARGSAPVVVIHHGSAGSSRTTNIHVDKVEAPTRPRSCVTSGVVNAPDGRWLADVADRRSDR
jgi:hypothetical protein